MKKRIIRNAVMIVLAGAIIGASVFTMFSVGSGSAGRRGAPTHGEAGMNAPPNMQGGNAPDGFGNGNNSDNSQGNTPPQMPNNGNQNGNGSDNSQGNTPPQMPNNDNQNGNNSGGFGHHHSDGGSDSQNDHQGKGFNDDSSFRGPHSGQSGGENLTLKYTLFGAEALIFSMIIAYLILSGFNKKGFRASFKGASRIVIYILCVLIAATALTGAQIAVYKNLPAVSSSAERDFGGSQGGPPNGGAPNGGSSSVEASGSTTVEDKQTLSDSYSSENSDESAILVQNGGSAEITDAKITKSGDGTNTENSDFYGVNAAVLVKEGSTATISGATITTDAKGGNAVFSTGTDSKVYISDSTITTTGDRSSRGLDATYGGYIEGDNVTITTSGGSCAALATDRGEGTVKVKNSNLTTNGAGSPIIDSTGDISVTDTKGTANGAQIAVVEGRNSATVTSSDLSCSGTGNRGDVDPAGVMIYQSMSGDADTGTGSFTATDSTLTVSSDSAQYKTAPMFFVTNTNAVIDLKNTKLSFGSGILLSAKGTDEWGSTGSNGGTVTLNATNQTLKGDITLDKLSTLTMTMTKSSYKGTINGDNTASSVKLTLDKDSKITLTGDSYVTELNDADSTYSNIDFNGYKLYVNGKEVSK